MFVLLSCSALMTEVLPAGTTLEVGLSNATGSSISEGRRSGGRNDHCADQPRRSARCSTRIQTDRIHRRSQALRLRGQTGNRHDSLSIPYALERTSIGAVNRRMSSVQDGKWISGLADGAIMDFMPQTGTAKRLAGVMSFPLNEISEVHHLLNGSPQRARLGAHTSDFVNLLFLGSRDELDRAFHAAGWSQAERKSPMSLYRMYHALTRRIGYRRAPMNTLTLNGAPSDFVYQKNLDTVQRRHHVRLWKDPSRADVWLGAAAEEIA